MTESDFVREKKYFRLLSTPINAFMQEKIKFETNTGRDQKQIAHNCLIVT